MHNTLGGRASIVGFALLSSFAFVAPAAATLFETARQSDYGFAFSTPSTAYNISMFTTGGIVASNIVIAPG